MERIIYRGIHDILPSRVQHFRVCEHGVWGMGTYFSPCLDTASWYAFKNMKTFGFVITYGLKSPLLILSEYKDFDEDHPTQDTINLTDRGMKKLRSRKKTILKVDVLNICLGLGYSGVEIDSPKRLGEPIIVLSNEASVAPVSYSYRTFETDDATQFPAEEVKKLTDIVRSDKERFAKMWRANGA